MSGATVALGPWGEKGSAGAGGGMPNMLQMAQEAMRLRQTGQEFAARQRFGQIMSGTGGDIDEAMKQAQQDPVVGAFAPQLMTELRSQQLLQYQTQQQQLGVAKSAREGLLNVLQISGNDPTKMLPALQGQFGSYDPRTQRTVKEYGDTIYHTLTDGLPTDPVQAQQEFAKRKAMLMVSSGLSKDIATAAGATGFGIPGIHDVPGVGPTPTVLDPFGGGMRMGGGLAPPAAPPPARSGLPLPAPAGDAVPGGVVAPGGGAPVAPAPTAPAAPAPAAGGPPAPSLGSDGKPLYDPTASYPVPYSFGTGGTGAPILSEALREEAKTLSQHHGGDGLKSFQAVQQTQASLEQIDAAYDNMSKGGGFLQPGAAGDVRAQLASIVNTTAQLFGKSPPFEPSEVASAEQLRKETERMALQVTNQFLGGQKEAAQTINRIASSVPSINNSYLGGKLIIAGIRASSQRLIDQRNFENAWLQDPRHGGNLLGAAEAFNQRAPAAEYARRELDSFGLLPSGKFKSPQDVMQMRARGLMTDKQIDTILADQFGIRPPAPAPAR